MSPKHTKVGFKYWLRMFTSVFIFVEMIIYVIKCGTLDLLMTDVPDLVQVAVVAPIGNSDQSSLSAIILMAQAVPNLCVSRKIFLKHLVNWNTVCGAIQELPWCTFGFLTILLRF